MPQNPFRDAQGEPCRPFTLEAEAYDIAWEDIKRHAIYVDENTWEQDISGIVFRLRRPIRQKPPKAGWLCFIGDETH